MKNSEKVVSAGPSIKFRQDVNWSPTPVEDPRGRLHAVRDIFYERCIGEDRISLAEGGCLLPPPIEVLKILQQSAYDLKRFTHQIYPQENASPEFLSQIQHYFSKECGIPFDEQMGVLFGFGSSHIFDGVLSVLCQKGDIVLMPTSYYHAFSEWPAKWGAHAEEVESSKENAYKLTAEDLNAWFAENSESAHRVKCLVITNPTTTGAVYTRRELEALAQSIKHHDLIVFNDEVFRDSAFTGVDVLSIAAIEDMNRYVVTATSGSKTKSVADLRIGWGCGPKKILDRVAWHFEHSFTEVPLYLQAIGTELLKTPADFLEEARLEYEFRVELIYSLVERLNKEIQEHFQLPQEGELVSIVHRPEAGHYVALDFGGLKGWTTPWGQVLRTNEELTRYFYFGAKQPSESTGGVCFSSGYSKGHDEFILYAAFAQLGFEAVTACIQKNLQRELLRTVLKEQGEDLGLSLQVREEVSAELSRSDLRNVKGALQESYNVGRRELQEAFARVSMYIRGLEPAAEQYRRRSSIENDQFQIAQSL